LGVDDDDSQTLLEAFVDTVAGGGCSKFYIHARKALLNGLSPAQNRVIPPLDYPRVYQLKAAFPDLTIILNGGINDSESAIEQLAHVDGIMVGRQAYHNPLIMNELSQRLCAEQSIGAFDVMRGYLDYMESELLAGTRLQDMTRHCLGLFSGTPGARHYRRLMSDSKRLRSNDLRVVEEALDCVQVSSIAA
jgi:tRNA-dihydrouridine synthase A